MKTPSEIDEIKRLKAELKRVKQCLADEIIDHKIDFGDAPHRLQAAWHHP